MVRKVFVGIIAAACCASASIAIGPSAPVDVPVATLLGKPITQADLRAEVEGAGIDPETFVYWGDVLREVVMSSLKAKYIGEHGLHAQESEVQAYMGVLASFDASMRQSCAQSAAAMRSELFKPGLSQEARASIEAQVGNLERASRGERWPDAETRAQLAIDAQVVRQRLMTENLTDAERAKLIESLVYMDRYGGLSEEQAKIVFERTEAETQRSMAVLSIENWKFNEAVYQIYGGQIVPHEEGPEAFDATRMWLEAREDAGEFAILDQSLTDGFWSYYTSASQTSLLEAPTGREFAEPWWEQVVVPAE